MRAKRVLIICAVVGLAIAFNIGGHNSLASGTKGEESEITFEKIAEANSGEKVLSRHKSWMSDIILTEDEYYDLKTELYEASRYTTYAETDFAYTGAEMKDSKGELTYFDYSLYTKDGCRCIEPNKEGNAEYYYYWYAMEDDEKSEYITGPDFFNPVGIGGDEKIVSVENQGDGTISVTTSLILKDDESIFYNIPDEWKDKTVEYEYILDEKNLELQKINCKIIVDDTTIDIFTQTMTYDCPEPEECADLRAFNERVSRKEFKKPRTITVFYNYGTDEEESYMLTADSDYFVRTTIREGYSYYDDPEGTTYEDKTEKNDVILYAIKD